MSLRPFVPTRYAIIVSRGTALVFYSLHANHNMLSYAGHRTNAAFIAATLTCVDSFSCLTVVFLVKHLPTAFI